MKHLVYSWLYRGFTEKILSLHYVDHLTAKECAEAHLNESNYPYSSLANNDLHLFYCDNFNPQLRNLHYNAAHKGSLLVLFFTSLYNLSIIDCLKRRILYLETMILPHAQVRQPRRFFVVNNASVVGYLNSHVVPTSILKVSVMLLMTREAPAAMTHARSSSQGPLAISLLSRMLTHPFLSYKQGSFLI